MDVFGQLNKHNQTQYSQYQNNFYKNNRKEFLHQWICLTKLERFFKNSQM